MNNKLRKRFVIVSTLISFIVLGLIIAFINVSNYRTFLKDRDDYLKEFLDSKADIRNERINSYIKRYDDIYVIDYNKNIRKTINDRRAEVLKKLANRASNASNRKGVLDKYRFFNDKANKKVYLVNMQRGYKVFYSTLINSIIVLILAMIFVFILSYLLSGYVIKPIVESQEKQKKFITDASHELRTPITIIKTNSDVLEYDLKDNRSVQNIKSAANRLNYLVNDLIALAKLGENKKAVYEKFDSSNVANEVITKYSAALTKKGCTLSAEVESKIIISAVREEFIKMINILMDNASKYSSPDTEIIFKLYKKQSKLYIETINYAKGLEHRDYKEIFDRFTRLDNHRNIESGGSGIGLSILKSIASKYGGSVSANSDGTTLKIVASIPL